MKLNLRGLRKSRGFTQEYLARECGISQQLYRAYETGKVKRPYLVYLERFCQVLDCDVGDLLVREHDKLNSSFTRVTPPNNTPNP